MARPDPAYDLVAAIETAAPGVVLQRAIVDGCAAAYALGGYVPLTTAQIIAVTGPLPAPVTSIPRCDRYGDDAGFRCCP